MRSLSHRFREQARRTPDAIALMFKDERVTYDALAARVDQLAAHLQERGIERGDAVALAARQSPDLIAALLAVAELGAAHVGIDPAWPLARVGRVLEDANPKAVVVDDKRAARALPFSGGIIALSSCRAALGTPPDPRSDPADPEDLFSIVYTSGSTGRPKGVLVTARSVLNKLEWIWNSFPFEPGDVAFVHRPPTTAGLPLDYFGALLQGCPTVISPVEDPRDAHGSLEAACGAGVTWCGASVGFWETALDRAERQPGFWPTLRLARSSGEPLPPGLVDRWRRAFPHARLLNIYGATECSGSIVYDTALFDPASGGRVPVGRPIAGVELLVVDSQMRSVAAGESGEVCIGGASLARGYLGDRQLSLERFVPHPAGLPDALIFRTGDIGFMRPDGHLEITGRRDLQVKVRGYRVEIEEVEAALRRCPGVRAAAVRGQESGGGTWLTAFVVPENEAQLSPPVIRRTLDLSLPGYMVPAEIVVVDALPRTSTGKIDRTALAALAGGGAVQAAAAVSAPGTSTEAAVTSIWSEVLGLTGIGREDDFFEIGGHSLSGARIISRLQDALGLTIPLRVLFDNPSVGALSAEIDRLVASEPSAAEPSPAEPWQVVGATAAPECRS